jgi:hypothetical protein
MLKSTYKVPASTCPHETPLPQGWTVHKAPTGHTYFYNVETKESTYIRPVAPPPISFFSEPAQSHVAISPERRYAFHHNGEPRNRQSLQRGFSGNNRADRPKKRKVIPDCEPWILVTTKLGRRFVHNPETNESFWKFPQDVLLATFKMDRLEQEVKDGLDRDAPRPELTAASRPLADAAHSNRDQNEDEKDESDYDEVEVTDDEEADQQSLVSQGRSKKQHTEPSGPVEFNEEDIAYQLAQMGQDYGLDPGEYGDGEDEEHDTGLPLSLEESQALFQDLLNDSAINPYTTWEKIVQDGRIIGDERYVALPNMRARKEAFHIWSTKGIHELQVKRQKEEKEDPRIPYLRLLNQHASPKLYWPEFKRKYRKEDAMKTSLLADRDREKIYRDHINRLKLPESTRKSHLKEMLASLDLTQLHRDSTLDSLPSTVLADVRYISLPDQIRDGLIEAYICTLPPPSAT